MTDERPTPGASPSLVPRTGTFEGLVAFRDAEPVVLHGQVEGDVCGRGGLVIGEAARVRGSVRARDIVVEGTVAGDVEAARSLEIRSTGVVEGAVTTASLSLQEGAELRGRCRMRPQAACPSGAGSEDPGAT